MIEIICQNTNTRDSFPLGTSLLQIANEMGVKTTHPILGAFVNNKLKELSYHIYKPKTIEFIDITHPDGMRMYFRSLSFVLQKAVDDILPGKRLRIEHAISKGYYCEIEGLQNTIEIDTVFAICNRMKEIIQDDVPFTRNEILSTEAIKLFEESGLKEKALLFKSRPQLYSSVYSLNGNIDYFYGFLVPSTGYLKTFDLVKYYDGMLLRMPKSSNPTECEGILIQDKLFEVFQEYKNWASILNVRFIGNINEIVNEKKHSNLIKISEALQEKKVGYIADTICQRPSHPKLILISGPSSSGKTTFAQRLGIQLQVAGLKPVTLSLDNYFVNRNQTPMDENGDFDFEAIEALDVNLLNENLRDLFSGKEINLPKFSFQTGERFYDGTTLKIDDKTIVIAEGIHALNPKLTYKLEDAIKYKIYVSALTTVSLDNHNRIPTTDTRLVRRIIRDYKYRGYSAIDTINRWPSVRNGEEKNIFPYQENADVMFNTAVHYELGVLKTYAEPILREVPSNTAAYREAVRLLKFFSYMVPIPDDEVPPTSILREFLGGSSFKY
ncbi:MAG: nucleoside kinase [Salinivirgaceae bacterium]|nr:nucleoside kinase [Salinivirgaceae bacterium]